MSEWGPSTKERSLLTVNFVSIWSDLLRVFSMRMIMKNSEISHSIIPFGHMTNLPQTKGATLCNYFIYSGLIQRSMQINSSFFRKSVYKYCLMHGKVITVVSSLMDKQGQVNLTLWLAMVQIKYLSLNSGYRANFMRINFQKNLSQPRSK